MNSEVWILPDCLSSGTGQSVADIFDRFDTGQGSSLDSPLNISSSYNGSSLASWHECKLNNLRETTDVIRR